MIKRQLKAALLYWAMILFIIFLCAYTAIGQERKLVADETWLVSSGKSSFRLISSNQVISTKILSSLAPYRMTFAQKKDRHGEYWERSFYFKNEQYNKVVKFITTL